MAKNFLLTNEVSLQRKVKEALLAIRMEQALSKDRILELYLNEIYLGGGAYGVAAAALNLFQQSLDELTPDEAAFLAGLPKAPNNYNPQRNPEGARKARRDWVIDRMVEDGYLTPRRVPGGRGEADHAAPPRRRPRPSTADYFTEEVRRELLQRYGEKGLYKSGLAGAHQPRSAAAGGSPTRRCATALIAYDRRHGWRGPVEPHRPGGDWQARLDSRCRCPRAPCSQLAARRRARAPIADGADDRSRRRRAAAASPSTR